MRRMLLGVLLTALTTTVLADTPVWRDPALKLAFVDIPKGCFFMGFWYEDEPEENRYKVCLKPFQMMQHEVTNAQFRQYQARHDSGTFEDLRLNQAQQPVVNVTLAQAQGFAAWLSAKTGQHFGLPTEAQWEYAAKAGTSTETFFGDDLDQACEYANVSDEIGEKHFTWMINAECQDGYVVSAPVGQFQPNPFGLYDIMGNVWEWTCSAHAEPYNGQEQVCTKSTQARIVFRGGGWATRPSFLGSTVRRYISPEPLAGRLRPTLKGVYLGFRLVRTLNQ